jgi:predicted MFS family arabinose efflux permease
MTRSPVQSGGLSSSGGLRESAPARHPLAEPAFRAMWSAYVLANIGVWIQTVGAAWLMTTLTSDALPVALVQTATTLPAFVVGLPAGSLGDRVDRRRLVLVTQAWMVASVLLLAVLTQLGVMTPTLLLLLTFALGTGSAMNTPTWAALLPDIVSRSQVPTAISINSAGFNIARAVGPAIGGIVVAAYGAAASFLLVGAAFLATFGFVVAWRPRLRRVDADRPREGFARAILTGLQFAWRETPQRIVLTRSVIWMLCASVLWGLLPLVARRDLELDAGGYGFLVTCVGIGAVAGSFALPRLRRRWSTNSLLITYIFIFAAMLLTLAWIRFLPVVWLMLALGGAAWTSSNQNFQIAVQMHAPGWVRARAIAAYILTFQGGQAIGSALWGAVAERTGDPLALSLAAAGLAAGLLAAVRWPVQDTK